MVKVGLLAEKYGFFSLLIGDHALDLSGLVKVDPWSVLSMVGSQTERVRLSTDVTDVLRSHPSRVAHTTATLDELTGGRVSLGLGAGEAMNIVPFGIPFGSPPERIQRLKEGIEVIRLLWNSSKDDRASFAGRFYSLKDAWLQQTPIQSTPPIYVGSLGARKTLELIGEVGDGWYSACNSVELFRKRVKVIRDSATSHKRDSNSIDMVASLVGVLNPDAEAQKKAIDAYKHGVLVLTNIKTLKEMGFEARIPPDTEVSYQKILAHDESVKVSEEMAEQMPDQFVEQFMVIGSADDFIEAVDAYRKAGATHVLFWDMVAEGINSSPRMAEENLGIYRDKVMKYFTDDGASD